MTMSEPDTTPRHPYNRWDSTGELMLDLMRGITPRPFWIQFDNHATKVTEENAQGLSHGLLLALEFKLARDEEAEE